MKNLTVIFLFLISVVSYSFSEKSIALKTKSISIDAPFGNVAVSYPDFSNCRRFNITAFGATADDQKKTSLAIVKAIDKASKANGGIVVIPSGEWLTGKIHLKSNVNLHLEEGAVLLFSDNPTDYLPAVRSTWEGYECYNYSPLIYAYGCRNVAITGKGILKAKMATWEKWFARPRAHMQSLRRLYFLASYNQPVEDRQMVNDSANLRPQFIQFNRCENILMEGVSIQNSPFWTIHPFLSKNVVIRDIKVFAHGHNNDGVDPEMSQNVLIENCVFDQGDDAIAIKSGSNQDAWRLNTPSKNIIIRNVLVKNGHQLVALGSELSGGIENVFIDSCKVTDGAKLNHLLYIKTNERRGGYVKNIFMFNTSAGKIDQGILGIETDVLYQWKTLVPTIERRLTPISNVYLSNVRATQVKFVSRILGQAELPVNNIVLNSTDANSIEGEKHICENVMNFKAD